MSSKPIGSYSLSGRTYHEYGVGTDVYYDTAFSGLIAGRVVKIDRVNTFNRSDPDGMLRVWIRLTATNPPGAFKKGEIVEVSHSAAVPRSHVKRTRFGHRVLTNYSWKDPYEGKQTGPRFELR